MMDTEKLYRTPEIAHLFGLNAAYLRKLRQLKKGPKYVKIDKAVFYRKLDVEEWLKNTASKTSSSNPLQPQQILSDGHNNLTPCPELLIEDELIRFLRIPEISKSNNYHNVIVHLKQFHNLPCIYLCNRSLYPINIIREWVESRVKK